MIKVLHLVGIMNRAGLETFIMNMYRNIDNEKISFDFLCMIKKEGEYDEEIRMRGGNIFYLPVELSGGFTRHIVNYRIMVNEFKKYVEDYDILHIHNYHAFDSCLSVLPAIRAGFKHIVIHSHSTSAEFHPVLHKAARPLLRNLPINKMACSSAAGKWLYGNEDFAIISNGIDVHRFAFDLEIRESYRKNYGVSDCFVIGHVGRFEYVKNHKFICDISQILKKNIPNVRICFVGDGVEKNSIQEYCKKNEISCIDFFGVRDDADKLYQMFDMFIFPSFFEGIPLAIMEAQAAGLPCVVSTGVPQDVDINDNVFHESLEFPDKWVERIVEISKSTFDRSLGAGNVIAAGYDVKGSCQRLQDFYCELVKEK